MLPMERQKLLKEVEKVLPDWAPLDNAILVGLRGSDAHGTKLEDKGPNDIDDVDVFVVTVQDLEFYLGLKGYGLKNQHWDSAGEELDVLVYDVRKFMDLASKSNPNVLNWLFNRKEDYLLVHPLGDMLLRYRSYFLSQEIFPRLIGYAHAQMKRMEADKAYQGYMGEKRKKLVDEFGYDLKNAGHCVRLLLTGIELAQFGTFSSYRPEHDIAIIKDIKRGKYSLEDVMHLIEGLRDQFRRIEDQTTLPERCDKEAISGFLYRVITNFNGVEMGWFGGDIEGWQDIDI